ncbi:hypothetical protein SLS62_009274 [Diatrype stigma]|uniref:Uncharacterized protein n=1 Tax=Diatrype stigma TaxID=117547 RepID=A0AAN9YLD3_9PEZI
MTPATAPMHYPNATAAAMARPQATVFRRNDEEQSSNGGGNGTARDRRTGSGQSDEDTDIDEDPESQQTFLSDPENHVFYKRPKYRRTFLPSVASSPEIGVPTMDRDSRSRRPASRSSFGGPARDRSPQRTPLEPTNASARSPPRGPAALRPPPTGPRDPRGYGNQSANAIGPPPRPAPASTAPPNRHDTSRNAPAPSPTLNRQEISTSPGGVPPSGPRSHYPPRGGGYSRGGRGGSSWGATVQSRNLPSTTGPASASPGPTNSSVPPTGPRGSISYSVPATPVSQQSKPFDPPKGPAADKNKPSFAQQLLASMPPILPGGKIDPAQLAMDTGVLPELQAHTQRLKEEEERIREDKYIKEERLRKSLAEWDRMERESKVMELRDQLAEQSLKKISGEGTGGAAF